MYLPPTFIAFAWQTAGFTTGLSGAGPTVVLEIVWLLSEELLDVDLGEDDVSARRALALTCITNLVTYPPLVWKLAHQRKKHYHVDLAWYVFPGMNGMTWLGAYVAHKHQKGVVRLPLGLLLLFVAVGQWMQQSILHYEEDDAYVHRHALRDLWRRQGGEGQPPRGSGFTSSESASESDSERDSDTEAEEKERAVAEAAEEDMLPGGVGARGSATSAAPGVSVGRHRVPHDGGALRAETLPTRGRSLFDTATTAKSPPVTPGALKDLHEPALEEAKEADRRTRAAGVAPSPQRFTWDVDAGPERAAHPRRVVGESLPLAKTPLARVPITSAPLVGASLSSPRQPSSELTQGAGDRVDGAQEQQPPSFALPQERPVRIVDIKTSPLHAHAMVMTPWSGPRHARTAPLPTPGGVASRPVTPSPVPEIVRLPAVPAAPIPIRPPDAHTTALLQAHARHYMQTHPPRPRYARADHHLARTLLDEGPPALHLPLPHTASASQAHVHKRQQLAKRQEAIRRAHRHLNRHITPTPPPPDPQISPSDIPLVIEHGEQVLAAAEVRERGAFAASWARAVRKYRAHKVRAYVGLFIGCVAGFFGGLLGISGPILIIYFSALGMHTTSIRDTCALVFFVNIPFMVAARLAYSVLKAEEVLMYLLAVPPMLGGLWLGWVVHPKCHTRIVSAYMQLLILLSSIPLTHPDVEDSLPLFLIYAAVAVVIVAWGVWRLWRNREIRREVAEQSLETPAAPVAARDVELVELGRRGNGSEQDQSQSSGS